MENRIRNYNLIPDELKRENIWLIAADVDGNIGGKIPHTLTNQDKLVKCNINIKIEKTIKLVILKVVERKPKILIPT